MIAMSVAETPSSGMWVLNMGFRSCFFSQRVLFARSIATFVLFYRATVEPLHLLKPAVIAYNLFSDFIVLMVNLSISINNRFA